MKYKIKIIKENIYLTKHQMGMRRKEMYRRFRKSENLEGKAYKEYNERVEMYDVDEAFECGMMSENHYKDMKKYFDKLYNEKNNNKNQSIRSGKK